MIKSNNLVLGCIADDFTGASDMASFLVKGGMKTVLYNGIPDRDYVLSEDIEGIVIALKTRSIEKQQSIKESLEAINWLKQKGARKLYFKYCSTFDSTKDGNIGPVSDALLEYLDQRFTILSPGLPINKRVVKDGILYVNEIPLGESYMKSHPLNPMWASSIEILMREQSKYPVFNINLKDLDFNVKLMDIDNHCKKNNIKHYYIVPNYQDQRDEELIVENFGDLNLLTGSSGLGYELGLKYGKSSNHKPFVINGDENNKSVVLVGSFSNQTTLQMNYYYNRDKKSIEIDPLEVIEGQLTIKTLMSKVNDNDKELMFFTSRSKVDHLSQEEVSLKLEDFISDLAVELKKINFNNIIVAGGETSGAVVKKLGYRSYIVGDSVSPGVPILIPEEDKKFKIILKSGNFGEEDFFIKGFEMMNN